MGVCDQRALFYFVVCRAASLVSRMALVHTFACGDVCMLLCTLCVRVSVCSCVCV